MKSAKKPWKRSNMHGKSLGKDGFTPAGIYLEFFDLLGEDLIESFNAA